MALEDVYEVFREYISEIHFEPRLSPKTLRGYIEIKEENLEDIKYEI
jgi:arginyl-tRNA--protein-N-Asp/Glu arginylyltransferase